ncbi:ER-derived vesicles protein ERV14 [Pelomyxa schiedti]|nr:ER-derived vesicles protein ERV14 [Pelomyxa schiedti]
MLAFLVWITSLVAAGALICLTVVALIAFSDCESDDLNPMELAKTVNLYVLPEYLIFGVMMSLFLISGLWLEILINLPLLGFHLYQWWYHKEKIDPTKVFTDMTRYKIVYFSKLGFFMLCFFFYLYRFIYTLVTTLTS